MLLNCAVPVILLGWDACTGHLGANPVNFAIRTTGLLSLIFLVLTLARHSREPDHRLELAGPVPPDAGALRVLSRLSAFPDLLRVRPRGEHERHSLGDHQASLPDGGNARPGADGAAGGDLDRWHDQAPGRQALEGAAPAGLRRRGGGRGPLLHAREGRRTQPVAFAVALAVLLGYRLVAHYLQLRSAYHKLRSAPATALAPRHRAGGEAEVLVGSTEGRPQSSTRPPESARFASCRPPAPGCRSTSCPASI